MEEFENKVFKQIKQIAGNKLNDINISFSGGVDSTALYHVMRKLKQKKIITSITLWHCNHKVQADNDKWEQHVLELARINNDKAFIVKLENHSKKSESELRIQRYNTIANTINSNKHLFLAHHFDDQVETILMRFMNKSAAHGLNGIKEVDYLSGLTLYRPMLNITKAEILNYAKSNKLQWCEDKSNKKSNNERNKWRNTIIPHLKPMYPDIFVNKHKPSMHLIEQFNDYESWLLEVIGTKNYICTEKIQEWGPERSINALKAWLRYHKIPTPCTKQIIEFIRQIKQCKPDKAPQLKLNHYYRIVVNRN